MQLKHVFETWLSLLNPYCELNILQVTTHQRPTNPNKVYSWSMEDTQVYSTIRTHFSAYFTKAQFVLHSFTSKDTGCQAPNSQARGMRDWEWGYVCTSILISWLQLARSQTVPKLSGWVLASLHVTLKTTTNRKGMREHQHSENKSRAKLHRLFCSIL